MPIPTREEVEARLVMLRRDLDLATATYEGAIQDCEWFLSQYDALPEDPETVKEEVA